MSNIENSLKNLDSVESRKLRKIWDNLISTKTNSIQSVIVLGFIISTYLKTDIYSTIIKVLNEGRKLSEYSREEILEDLFIGLLVNKIKDPFLGKDIYDYIRKFREYSKFSDGEIFKLKELNLSSNKLFSLPESIGNLTKLQKLYLVDNKLTSLPESFGNLINLQELHLSHNQLSSLPESIGNLSNLKELYLSVNRLSSLPESFGDLSNLEMLDFSSNQFSSLPESIGNLSNLRALWSSHNKLSSLPESLGNLSNLLKLDLFHNQLNSQAQSVLKTLVMTNSVITELTTNNFDFSEELQRNERGEPAPGRTTVKAVEFY